MFAFILLVINMAENVNILAHLGGLVFGLVVGYVLASRCKIKSQVQYTINYS